MTLGVEGVMCVKAALLLGFFAFVLSFLGVINKRK